MIERVKILMSVKNLTSSDFAANIQVQRSGISHILSGRNKPSLDFVMKVLEAFPDVDEAWLLFGRGEMFKGSLPVPQSEKVSNIISEVEEMPTGLSEEKEDDRAEGFVFKQEQEASYDLNIEENASEKSITEAIQKDNEPSKEYSNPPFRKKIVKLLAIYNDDSFKEYYLHD